MKKQADITREYDRLKEQGTELDNLVPVRARVSPKPRMVFSVRLSTAEFALISDASKQDGAPISEFIRLAALAAASGKLDLHAGKELTTLAKVREKARELAELADNI